MNLLDFSKEFFKSQKARNAGTLCARFRNYKKCLPQIRWIQIFGTDFRPRRKARTQACTLLEAISVFSLIKIKTLSLEFTIKNHKVKLNGGEKI